MIFEFKSQGVFFEKEREGIKPNTIRKIDLSDDRFLELIKYNQIGYNEGDLIIKITNPHNAYFCKSFERVIEDISIYEDWMIISWKHQSPQSKENSQEEKE